MVEKGQLLYSIDPREFRAQVANAEAQVASAEANLSRSRQDVERYRPLLADEAIARQVYDNAVAAARQAEAQVHGEPRRARPDAARHRVRADSRAPAAAASARSRSFPAIS